MRFLRSLAAVALVAFLAAAPAGAVTCNTNFDFPVCINNGATMTFASGTTLDVSAATLTTGAIAAGGTITTDAVAGATAAPLAIGNATSTAVSLGNSAACDTVTIATNTDADTVTIGEANDTVSAVSALWSITGPGVGTFSSVVTNTITGASGTTLTIGDTVSTAVSIANSAAADTVNIATNADADAVTIGDWANDTVKLEGAVMRPKSGTTFTAADPNPSKATLQAARFWLVDTTSNAVDLDFADDAALDAADVGSEWRFMVSVGGTNALTVTAGASGVTTVTTRNAEAGATCEDPGDHIDCVAYTTTAISCDTFCAD